MDSSEQTLKAFYEAHREEWVRNFVKGLQAAKLKSYANVPEAALIPAVGKSMDLLIHCLLERDPERYVNAQRQNFEQRVASGVDVLDITQGLDVASQTLDKLFLAALSPSGHEAMKQRADRYLLMTRTTLLGLLGAKRKG